MNALRCRLGLTLAGLAVIAAGAVAPVWNAFAQANEAAELEAVQEQYRQAWQRGDLDAVMAFWTPDAKVLGPGSVVAGTQAIRASLEQSVKLGIRDLRHIDREVYGNGSTVVEITQSVAYDQAGKELVSLRYMTLWQKAGGRWRIHREFAIPIVVSEQLLKAGQKAQ